MLLPAGKAQLCGVLTGDGAAIRHYAEDGAQDAECFSHQALIFNPQAELLAVRIND
jgi:hypothetical protein